MPFTDEEHAKLRNFCERESTNRDVPIRWLKAQLRAIFDDLDIWLASEKPTIATTMDASAPGLALTNAEKKWMFGVYMEMRFPKELV